MKCQVRTRGVPNAQKVTCVSSWRGGGGSCRPGMSSCSPGTCSRLLNTTRGNQSSLFCFKQVTQSIPFEACWSTVWDSDRVIEKYILTQLRLVLKRQVETFAIFVEFDKFLWKIAFSRNGKNIFVATLTERLSVLNISVRGKLVIQRISKTKFAEGLLNRPIYSMISQLHLPYMHSRDIFTFIVWPTSRWQVTVSESDQPFTTWEDPAVYLIYWPAIA